MLSVGDKEGTGEKRLWRLGTFRADPVIIEVNQKGAMVTNGHVGRFRYVEFNGREVVAQQRMYSGRLAYLNLQEPAEWYYPKTEGVGGDPIAVNNDEESEMKGSRGMRKETEVPRKNAFALCLEFVKEHPGATSRDVRDAFGDHPQQQSLSPALSNLAKQGRLERRKGPDGLFRYYANGKTESRVKASSVSNYKRERETWEDAIFRCIEETGEASVQQLRDLTGYENVGARVAGLQKKGRIKAVGAIRNRQGRQAAVYAVVKEELPPELEEAAEPSETVNPEPSRPLTGNLLRELVQKRMAEIEAEFNRKRDRVQQAMTILEEEGVL